MIIKTPLKLICINVLCTATTVFAGAPSSALASTDCMGGVCLKEYLSSANLSYKIIRGPLNFYLSEYSDKSICGYSSFKKISAIYVLDSDSSSIVRGLVLIKGQACERKNLSKLTSHAETKLDFGKICLGLTRDQIQAALGPPTSRIQLSPDMDYIQYDKGANDLGFLRIYFDGMGKAVIIERNNMP